MSTAATLILLFVALAFSAFFSSVEMAYTSLNKLRLESLAEHGSRRARLAKKISDHYDVTMSSLLISGMWAGLPPKQLPMVLPGKSVLRKLKLAALSSVYAPRISL